MPLVSIIMNVRNGAATLSEALDSVLAQTFADWELIAWDDRSSDPSAAIIARYHDRRIRYHLSPEEVPLGKARSHAMRLATGAWIAFLDQDDIWLPSKLDKQMALADDGVGLIYGRTIRFYLSGKERDYDQAHEYKPLPEGDIFTQLFTESCFIAMSSAVFRRSAVEAIGGIPDPIQIIPDYYLYVAVARRYQIRAVQEAVCRYRMGPNSMSQVAALQMHREALWLVDQWAATLDPSIVQRCHKRHQTAIALEEMRSLPTLRRGMARLFTEGSVASQMSRPFTFAFHWVRRNVRRPYWRLPEGHSSV
jgi:cellulose synthase/poly-beta-1,6-N-acetylglucosamine synthase-like glycosyltransferase